LRLDWDGRCNESTPALFSEMRFVFFATSHDPRYVLKLSYSVLSVIMARIFSFHQDQFSHNLTLLTSRVANQVRYL